MRDDAQHELTPEADEEEWIPGTLEEFLDLHSDAIERVAKGQWNRQGFCDWRDVAQEVRLHVVEHWKHYQGKTADEAGRAFTRASRQYLSAESEDYMYFSGNFVYTPRMVRALLETSTWEPGSEVFDVDGRIDMQDAYDQLPPAAKRGVFKRYALKIPDSEMTDAEGKACRRGVDAITHYLNRREPQREVSLDDLRHKLFGTGGE